MGGAVGPYGLGQPGGIGLARGGVIRGRHPVLQGKEDSAEDGGGDLAFLYEGGREALFGAVATSHGNDAGL